MVDHLLVRENSRGRIRLRYLKAFKSKYRVRFGDIFHGVPKISQQKASRSQQSQPVNNTRVSEITIRRGMLVTGACAYPRKSTSSAWLGSFPASDRRDDVALNMDLIEGRVRYRKGKKVSCTLDLKYARFNANWVVLIAVEGPMGCLKKGQSRHG